MKQISVYLRNRTINPSGYYRVYQYLSKMHTNDCKIVYHDGLSDRTYKKYYFNSSKIHTILFIFEIEVRTLLQLLVDNIFIPDIVIINREVSPKYSSLIHCLLEKRLVRHVKTIWDFDDVIAGSEISRREWNLLKENSSKIVVTNDYLKKQLIPLDENKVVILPTTDGDYEYSVDDCKIREEIFKSEIRIVWVATSSNIKSLYTVIEELENSAVHIKEKCDKRLVLVCVCNKIVSYKTKNLEIVNIVWTREKALQELKKAHIGIMPLISNEFTKGKGGFKLIQYMAAGIPVIASPVGMNNDIVKENFGILSDNGHWGESIDCIIKDWNKWKEMSLNARKAWETNYAFDNNLKAWENLLEL